jgi:glycosyltransferase involved in cell wall biosynthesis
MVKKQFSSLKCLLFGGFKRPDYLADWYEYYQTPNKKTHNYIYNTASIFIAPAILEGFGLTPGEAMQCGCAVAASNNGGYSVMCKDNETALVCESANSHALSEIIIRLIKDDNLRKTIAYNGHEFVKKFTWKRAYGEFKQIIEEV